MQSLRYRNDTSTRRWTAWERLESRICLAANTFISSDIECCTNPGTELVHAADLDGDADLDVLATSSYFGNLKVVWFENDGAGGFGTQRLIMTDEQEERSGFRSLEASDVDGDGDLDVLLSSFDGLAWYPNDGQGNFSEVRLELFAQPFQGIIGTRTADLDNDGDLDILTDVSLGCCTRWTTWYANDGSFVKEEVKLHLDLLDVVDLDGDGSLDIVGAHGRWFANDGGGNFGERQLVSHAPEPNQAAFFRLATDWDGDGDADLLFASWQGMYWYENEGSGTFGSPLLITSESQHERAIFATDLDGDGDQDLISASGIGGDEGDLAWYENIGQGNISNGRPIASLPRRITAIVPIDFDGDGDGDVLSASYYGTIAWYETKPDRSLGDPRIISSHAEQVNFVKAADLDGDGDLDLGVSGSVYDTNEGYLSWYENDGRGLFVEQKRIATLRSLRLIDASDVDGDGDLDFISIFKPDLFNTKIAWHENAGDGNFGGAKVIWTVGSRFVSVRTADLDSDDDLDIVFTRGGVREIFWLENEGAGNFKDRRTVVRSQTSVDVAKVPLADLDNDQDLDMLLVSNGRLIRYLNDGSGNFGSPSEIATKARGLDSLLVADLDNDGDLDALGRAGGELLWHENDGSGSFGALQVIRTEKSSIRHVRTADFDADGDLDVLAMSTADGIFWFENDGSGNLADRQRHEEVARVRFVIGGRVLCVP